MPPHIADMLVLVHILLVYGRHLSPTLKCRAAIRGFSSIAQFFGTARLPAMHARIARGLLRIQALQRVLLDRARRGRDLVWLGPHQPRTRRGPPAQPQIPQDRAGKPADPPAPRSRPDPEAIPDPDNLPTLQQLVAQIRRRGIGRSLADICHDLGVSPQLCERRLATALLEVIPWYRGDLTQFLARFHRRKSALDPELDGTPPLRLPERTIEGMQRMLGFAIGDRWPVMPVLLPAAPISHADSVPRPP